MATKKSKYQTWDDYRDSESEADDSATDENDEDHEEDNTEEEYEDDSANEKTDDGDDSDDVEDDANETQEKTIVCYIDEMMEDLTGNLKKDIKTFKEEFSKIVFTGTGVIKTDFFKNFQKQLKNEKKTLTKQFSEDGVEKIEDEIDQDAYDATFESFLPRLENILHELYEQHDMEMDDEEEDEEEEEEEVE